MDLLTANDVRCGERRAVRFHHAAVEEGSARNRNSALHAEAGEGHEAGKGLHCVWNLFDECALIVERFDDAREIEALQITESAVDDPKGVVRCGVAAGVCFKHER